MDELAGPGEGLRPEILGIEQTTGTPARIEKKILKQAARDPTEGDAGGHPRGGRPPLQQGQGAGVGAPGELQGPGRSQKAQTIEQLHGGMGGTGADIPAHRPAVKLPERQKPGLTQPLMTPPEAGRQGLDRVGGLEAATDGHPPQGNTGRLKLSHPFTEGVVAPDAGVELHRIGLELLEQRCHGVSLKHMGPFADQPVGTGRQATTAAVAALLEHTRTGRNRQGRTDPLAGPGAADRTVHRVKPGLAEMGIGTIAEADHQPGRRRRTALKRPGDAATGGGHHSRIGRHIKAVDPGQTEEAGKILQGLEVLIAGATDHLHPMASGQSLLRHDDR